MGDKTEKVIVSGRMVASPGAPTTPVLGWSPIPDRTMAAQASKATSVDRTKKGQNDFSYNLETSTAVSPSSSLETLRNSGPVLLCMVDPADKCAVQELDGKALKPNYWEGEPRHGRQ